MIKAVSLLACSAAFAVLSTSATGAEPKSPSNLGCMLRMMDLTLLADKASQNPSVKPEEKVKMVNYANDARAASSYYVGLLGDDWNKTSHAAEGVKEFSDMRSATKEQRVEQVAVCLTRANAAQKAAIAALKPESK